MRETRINPETGRTQIKLKFGNLPEIWVSEGLCDRCFDFGECLGLASLSTAEWNEVENLIKEVQNPSAVKTQLEERYVLKKC